MKSLNISGGTKAEQIIAYVILANIELLQKTLVDAKRLIKVAQDIAEQLFYYKVSYHSPHLSKFACFIYEFEGSQQTLPLPILNNTLIIPAINLTEVTKNLQQSINKVVTLKDVLIGYFKLEFDTNVMIDMLQKARVAVSRDELASAIEVILSDSLMHESKPDDPLDVAKDYFVLARNLIAEGNVTLTRIALCNASKALDVYDTLEKVTVKQLERIQEFKTELKLISETV